jgi:hypothetical protein
VRPIRTGVAIALAWCAHLAIQSIGYAQTVRVSEEVTGNFGPETPTRLERPYIAYQAYVAERSDIFVEMLSSEFDPVLILIDPEGNVRVNDDGTSFELSDMLSDRDSSIRVLDAAAGPWIVLATSFSADSAGDYILHMSKFEEITELSYEGPYVEPAFDLAFGYGGAVGIGTATTAASSDTPDGGGEMAGEDDTAAATDDDIAIPTSDDAPDGGSETAGEDDLAAATDNDIANPTSDGAPDTARPQPSDSSSQISQFWLPAMLPWPPPNPSDRVVLDRSLLADTNGPPTTLGGVSDRLESALTNAGYPGSSYWGVPGGFALVTKLEQTDRDGTPLAGRMRWQTSIATMKCFCLTQYLNALLTAPPGFYRVLVFVVTTQEFAPVREREPIDTIERWSQLGLNDLPSGLRATPFTDEHEVTVLLYEFVKRSDADRPESGPARISARDHLRAAGLDLVPR